ncbi:MAG: pyridoxal phosphate-dependent aminotransferase [Candidatus Wildermuthbacteria bacterium]|nr:pyridoxal phosphate-dependent aminotransferase [Candidatus Wildermuthbacteria bacterium]
MTLKYNAIVRELREQKKEVTTLSSGEVSFQIPLFSFSELPIESLYNYSDSRGILALRKKISAYYEKEYGVRSRPETELLVSAGSKIIIYMALSAVLNPGEEVIVFEPAWVSYEEQIRLCRGVPVMVPYNEGVADIKKYITEKTKVIIVNNPTNPSGKVYTREELQALYEEAMRNDVFLISDEAYSDFTLEGEPFISMGTLDEKKERVIIINSMSKSFGVYGWRVGYVIANPQIINLILKINQHLVTCAPTVIQQYVEHHFEKFLEVVRPQIRETIQKRQEVSKYMEEIGLFRLPGTGTFYFFISIEGSKLRSEEFAMQLLQKYSVSTVPGIGYGKSVDRFLRVGIGAANKEQIKKGLQAIKTFIDETHE